jgi:hypothetical protein
MAYGCLDLNREGLGVSELWRKASGLVFVIWQPSQITRDR